MTPLILSAAGLVVLGAAFAILRSFGPSYRVGRLLAVAPRVSVAEAVRLANSGAREYVRVDGRLDSEAEFEDADHRPLVLRRTTVSWRPAGARGRWAQFDASLEVVPFVVREGLDEIDVDGAAIGDGLIVVPRERVGPAGELEQLAAAGIDARAQGRFRIEQVSTVEHAAVLGMPVTGPGGRPVIGPGLGRPLILSTLEDDEAMRVLTGGAAGRSRLAAVCLVAGIALVGLAALWWLVDALTSGMASALAASPDPTIRPGSDTRSSGAGPGIVGEPVLAVLGVLGVALASLLASAAYVRFSGPSGGRTRGS